MRNKIMALFIVLILVISAFPCGIIAAEGETSSEQYANEISFLQKIGVMDAKFDPQKTVTKAEFTKIILSVLQPNGDFSVTDSYEPIFVDVGPENMYYPYIKTCKDLRIITGDNANYFHPDSELTMIDTITILTNALGYTPYAKAYGGYPTGYYRVATETGMTKNVDLSQRDAISGAVMAKLVYNSLFADLVVISSVVSPDIQVEIDKNSNLLLSRLNIREYDAQVVDNGITSLLSDPTGDAERIVLKLYKEGTTLTVYKGETDIDNYIGSRLKVYVRANEETGRDEVVHYYVHSSSNEVTLDASKVISVTDSYLEYEKEKDSGKYQKYSFSAPLVIFNGVHLTSYTNDMLRFTDGTIRLIDTDNDNRFDVLDVISFNYYDETNFSGSARNIFVDSVGDMLNCKFNPAMSIDVSEENADYKFIWTTEYETIADLSTDIVVSVAKAPGKIDGKDFYFLAVREESAAGTVESVAQSDSSVTVNGTAYELSSSILSVKPNYLSMIRLGAEVTLHLDATGKVAYVETQGASKNYAYLIAAERDDGLNDEVRAKIFVPDTGVGEYALRGKVKIDGVTCDTPEKQMAALAKRPSQFARYEETDTSGNKIYGPAPEEYLSKPIVVKISSDGYVTEIETENPNYPEDSSAKGNVLNTYRSLTPIPYSEDEMSDDNTLKAALRTPRTAGYSTRTNCVDGRYFVTGSTRIISVPDIDTFGLKEYANKYGSSGKQFTFKLDLIKAYENDMLDENYKVLSSGQFNSDGRYDLQAYDIDPSTGVAGLLVVRGRTDILSTFSWDTANPMCAVVRMTDVYDEASGETVKKIYYTKDGVTEMDAVMNFDELPFYYRYLVEGHKEGDTSYTANIPPLKKGDIVRIGKTNGKLTHIERVANLGDLDSNLPMAWYPSGMTYPYTTEGGKTSKTFPFYMSTYAADLESTYVVGIGLIKERVGNNLISYTPKTTISDITPMDAGTYMESYIKAGSVPILTITTKASTGEVTIKKGSMDDIKTVAADGKDKASQVLFFHRLLTYSQLIIFNTEQ